MWPFQTLSLPGGAPAAVARARRYRRPKVKRICLFGLFGTENYGNDASLEAMLLFLRETWPEAVLSCVCIDPEKVRRAYDVPAISIRWNGLSSPVLQRLNKLALDLPHKLGNWIAAIRHMRNFDVLLVPGTGLLSDYYATPFGAPYAVFRWSVAARLAGARLFFASVGAGPAHRRLSRWMLNHAARLATYRSFRDADSKESLGKRGIDTRRDEVYTDLVFRLPVPDLPGNRLSATDPAIIAVGVMDYNGWYGYAQTDDTIFDTYLAKITRIVRSLLERGFRLRILVGGIEDQRAVARLQAALAADRDTNPGQALPCGTSDRIMVEPVSGLADVMRQVADASVVITSRFHNVVCALKLGRPTISLGYEPKNDSVMQMFDLSQFCQHIDRFDPDWVLRQVDEQLSNRAFYEQKIRQRLSDLRFRVADQERVLAELL